jgi:hypothetical protein
VPEQSAAPAQGRCPTGRDPGFEGALVPGFVGALVGALVGASVPGFVGALVGRRGFEGAFVGAGVLPPPLVQFHL